jgi:hypothetical protein
MTKKTMADGRLEPQQSVIQKPCVRCMIIGG